MIRVRAALDGISPYVPGRSGADAVGIEQALEVARLASNESPYPPAAPVVEAITAAAGALNRYPDDDVSDLREALAREHGVDAVQVAVGNGSSELLARFVIATCGPGDNAVFAWPSFVMYPILAELTCAAPRRVPLAGGRHDLDAMAAAVDARTRVVFVCTPNNPTGCAVGAAELSRFLGTVPDDVLVLLDEAYAEYVDPDAEPGVHADGIATVVRDGEHPNAVVLRTFSKAYGLAGLRCGYAVGDEAVLAELNKARLPFVVNSLAQRAALAAMQNRAECLASVPEVVAERVRVTRALVAAGFAVLPSQGNFVWLDVPGEATRVAAVCESAGVLVRPLGPDGVRITIGSPAENDRVVEALSR